MKYQIIFPKYLISLLPQVKTYSQIKTFLPRGKCKNQPQPQQHRHVCIVHTGNCNCCFEKYSSCQKATARITFLRVLFLAVS